MQPWVECQDLHVDLDLPVDQRFAALGDDVLERARFLMASVLERIPSRLKMIADAVRLRTRGRFHPEFKALSKIIGHDWRSIVLANVSYDLAMTVVGCSTVALPTRSGPVLARNMDWRVTGPVARSSYQMQWRQQGQLRYATAGFPGGVGVVTGLSARGFAVALNAIKGFQGLSKTGYPVLLHLRRVIEDARDFNQAVEMLTRQRLAAPAMFTVVGSSNQQRVVVERTKRDHAHRWGLQDQPLFTTNHFHILPRPQVANPGELFKTSFSRYDALCRFMADYSPDRDIEDDTLLDMLTDAAVLQQITAQHIIIRPSQQQMRLWVPRHLLEETASQAHS